MIDIKVGDVVELRKGHPCGANRWQVYRVGADIGLKCDGCGRRQLMPRTKFNRAFKRKLEISTNRNEHDQ